MWGFSPETSSEVKEWKASMRKGKVYLLICGPSSRLEYLLPLGGVHRPVLLVRALHWALHTAWHRQQCTFGSALSLFSLSSCPCSSHSLFLLESCTWQAASCPPCRPPGPQEMSSIIAALSPHNAPWGSSGHMAAFRWEEDSSLSIHIPRLQERRTTLSRTLLGIPF